MAVGDGDETPATKKPKLVEGTGKASTKRQFEDLIVRVDALSSHLVVAQSSQLLSLHSVDVLSSQLADVLPSKLVVALSSELGQLFSHLHFF